MNDGISPPNDPGGKEPPSRRKSNLMDNRRPTSNLYLVFFLFPFFFRVHALVSEIFLSTISLNPDELRLTSAKADKFTIGDTLRLLLNSSLCNCRLRHEFRNLISWVKQWQMLASGDMLSDIKFSLLPHIVVFWVGISWGGWLVGRVVGKEGGVKRGSTSFSLACFTTIRLRLGWPQAIWKVGLWLIWVIVPIGPDCAGCKESLYDILWPKTWD